MNNTKEQILNKIEEHDTIIIHRHVSPDPDALGSQGGLAKIIEKNFPSKKVYVVGEETEGLKFLINMDEVDDKEYKNALVIVVDTANTERISDERFDKGNFLIKIDHHPNRTPYGDLEWVDTSYSSTSEMIVDFYKTINDNKKRTLEMPDEAARLLFTGIVGDTGRFLYNNTTVQTMNYAAELMKYDFVPSDIFGQMYKMKKETAKLQGFVLQNFNVTEKGVASVFISKKIMNDFGVEPPDAGNLVNVLSGIEGNNVWVFFIEYDEEIRVRIRSKEVTINGVAQEFNGGGHPLASGATVSSEMEIQKLIDALDRLL